MINFIITLSLTILFLAPPFPLYLSAFAQDNDLTDKYIIVLNEFAVATSDIATDYPLEIDHSYHTVFKGYSAKVPKHLVDKLKKDRRVKTIIPDKLIHKAVTTEYSTQTPSTGYNRIGNRTNSRNRGSGIAVAVIDTGIDLNHPDLAANIVANTSCVKRIKTGNDDDGHGTHVAGIIAAVNNQQGVLGVAPETKLVAVKVLNNKGDGSWSNIICGIDWITQHAAQYNIKVVNLSLGGDGSSDNNCGSTNNDPLHKAICRSRDAGLTYVVAAGNEKNSTDKSVPAAYDDAVITVSALADSDGKPGGLGPKTSYKYKDDTFALFSNYGKEVDLVAPGLDIYSTWLNNSYKSLSGTSMATPFVSGAVSLYLYKFPTASWQQIRDGLQSRGEKIGSRTHTDPSGLHPERVVLVNTLLD